MPDKQFLPPVGQIMECPEFLTRAQTIAESAFIAPNATVIGDVHLMEDASVWYQSVLRADIHRIVVGPGTNVQDGTIIHLSDDYGVSLGAHVSIGHRAIIHACRIDDEVLIGMGAIVMDGTEIGARSIIGAGALVTQHQKIPPGSLVLGSPARVVRPLTEEEQQSNRKLAEKYIHVARFHREHLANSVD